MSEKDVEKIIEQLRSKTQQFELAEKPAKTKIDKTATWALAKKIRKTLSDDTIPAPNPSRA